MPPPPRRSVPCPRCRRRRFPGRSHGRWPAGWWCPSPCHRPSTAFANAGTRAALAGAGPHVTILYPFLLCESLVPADRSGLAAIAGGVPAFEVRFERVRRFADLVWIEPEPAEPFAALTAAVAERWPDHPPYGGTFETVIPHLTLVESEVAPLGAIEDAAARVAPFVRRAQRLELWCQDAAGRWRPRWRIPFGVRP